MALWTKLRKYFFGKEEIVNDSGEWVCFPMLPRGILLRFTGGLPEQDLIFLNAMPSPDRGRKMTNVIFPIIKRTAFGVGIQAFTEKLWMRLLRPRRERGWAPPPPPPGWPCCTGRRTRRGLGPCVLARRARRGAATRGTTLVVRPKRRPIIG